MEAEKYSEPVKSWICKVLENRTKDAETTLAFCNKMIEYGRDKNDAALMGFSFFHIAETYYCLNDGKLFFDNVSKALDILEEGRQWELIGRSYNILGITAANSGNAPIALDYYLTGLSYCKKYDIPDVELILNINCGSLNTECNRFSDAMKYLETAYNYMKNHKENPCYHTYMICIYQNMAACKIMQDDFKDVEELFELMHHEHWPHADYVDKIAILCSEAMFYHRSGNQEKRDECINQVDEGLSENVIILDLFEDFYKYCGLLLECDKDKEFWHVIDVLEPMVRNFKITNMQLMEISLKIKYYRKHQKSAEYLQAAGLYYELSELREKETQTMVNNMLNLRKNLEQANRVRKEVEVKNQLLQEKSQTDQLTELPNRFKLNDYADKVFERAINNNHFFAIEILDIDYFKEYNDNYGHQKGDECLYKVASVLKSMEEDYGVFCARYGGDEFIIIYENLDVKTVERYAEELRQRITNISIEHSFSKAADHVTVSQGICCDIPTKSNRVWDFLHHADDNLYKIKKKCRDSFLVGEM